MLILFTTKRNIIIGLEIHSIHLLYQFAAELHHHLGGNISFHSDKDHKQLPEMKSI
jgi:hypothetical protein